MAAKKKEPKKVEQPKEEFADYGDMVKAKKEEAEKVEEVKEEVKEDEE